MNAEAPGGNVRLRPVLVGVAVLAVIALAAFFALRAPAPARLSPRARPLQPAPLRSPTPPHARQVSSSRRPGA